MYYNVSSGVVPLLPEDSHRLYSKLLFTQAMLLILICINAWIVSYSSKIIFIITHTNSKYKKFSEFKKESQ